MKTSTVCFLLALVYLPSARALPLTSIDFETLTDLEIVTTQFSGLTFTNTTALSASLSLNEIDFPPRSGSNVVLDGGGAIAIDFSAPIESFSAFFTYTVPLTLTAFDGSGGVLGSATSAFSSNFGTSAHSSPNELIQLSGLGSINRIQILGGLAGSSFTMDDLTFESVSVPEPSSIALLSLALASIQSSKRKRLPLNRNLEAVE